MNISGVSASANTSYTQSTQTSNGSYTFAQIMELSHGAQTAKTSASSDAAARAASVRDGLDEETLMYLDKYTEIYTKYAEKYGDGFELKDIRVYSGDEINFNELRNIARDLSDEKGNRFVSVAEAFQTELYEAGIPGCGKRLTVEEYGTGQYTFMSPNELRNQYQAIVPALFYAEKYGLAGLTAEEQCKLVLNGLQTGTANDLRAAAGVLYRIGAISFRDLVDMDLYTSFYATKDLGQRHTEADFNAALNTPMDWSGLLEILKNSENGQSLYDLLAKAWEAQDDGEDEKLQVLMRKIDAYQEAIHESIERSNEKRREQEILGRANAESARLRVLFNLDNNLSMDTTDLTIDTAEAVASVL